MASFHSFQVSCSVMFLTCVGLRLRIWMLQLIHYFRPKTLGNSSFCQHTSYHVQNSSVLPLRCIILLGCVDYCPLPFYTILITKFCKFKWHVFSPTISTKGFYTSPNIILYQSFETFECCKSFRFLLWEINPSFPTIVINKGNKIFPFAIRYQVNGTTYIRMDQL